MQYILPLFVSILALVTIWAYPEKEPLVQIRPGYVRGKREVSDSRPFFSFRGIPFAQPPIGELRFKEPIPVEEWQFPVDATKDGPFCIQKNYFFANPKVEGSEDCLYLNVYVPGDKIDKELDLPVMVFIHWGGFVAGRGTSDYLGPEYLMQKDIILVTFNYRLGALGFLTTLDDEAPGNYGLKDQVLALRFVQENIKSFGGDPNKVTIFGQSAGGGSTSLHLVSPLSKGLFKQAISQSGNAFNPWAFPLNVLQPNVTAAQAAFVGCGKYVGNSKHVIDCLRNVDAKTLVDSADKFKYFFTDSLTVFSIVTETQTVQNPNPFITKAPVQYFADGEFQRVPWIVGNVQDEGILRASPFVRQPNVLEALNANFSSLIPQLLALQSLNPNKSAGLYQNVVNTYFGGKENVDINNLNSVQGLIDVYTDRSFIYGTSQAVLLQSTLKHFPIWLYSFDYRGQYTYGDLWATTDQNINFKWGTAHCDDLLYLFPSKSLFPPLILPQDCQVKTLLTDLWTDFAIYGSPDPKGIIGWRPLKFSSDEQIRNENLQFLNVTGDSSKRVKLGIQNGYFTQRVKFWAEQNIIDNGT